MRIDGQAIEVELFLADGALDSRARLPRVERNRLVVNDAPEIRDVRIGAYRRNVAAGIESRAPDMARDVHAHHVGGRKLAIAPSLNHRMLAMEACHGVVRRPDPLSIFEEL